MSAAGAPPAHRLWAVALVLLGSAGLLSGVAGRGGFASSYLLDVVGPAWNYILFRGLYLENGPRPAFRFVTPGFALAAITAVCFVIEGAQYLRLYDATYDPWDFLAYVSLLLPAYAIDRGIMRRGRTRRGGNESPVTPA